MQTRCTAHDLFARAGTNENSLLHFNVSFDVLGECTKRRRQSEGDIPMNYWNSARRVVLFT